MGRVMALDLGNVRIGIALSDIMGIIASGYETFIRSQNPERDMLALADLAKERNCTTIVIGLPKNMDGTIGEQAKATQAFGEKLKEHTEAKVTFWDERLSTVSAERSLIAADVKRKDRKKVIDKVAATIILQSYLDCRGNK
jgi:putative Holliday junction resolvase